MDLSRDNIEEFVGEYLELKDEYLNGKDLMKDIYHEKHYVKINGPIIILGRKLRSMAYIDIIYWDSDEDSWCKKPANALYFELKRYQPASGCHKTLEKLFG